MFVDYYVILGINETADFETLKLAYKREALKWHPDKNMGRDTTQRMQLINAAYLILSDVEARILYDLEYKRFKASHADNEYSGKEDNASYTKGYTYDFNVEDERLSRWIDNAMKQGLDLLRDTYSMTSGGIKEATKGAFQLIKVQFIIILICILIAIIVGFVRLLSV